MAEAAGTAAAGTPEVAASEVSEVKVKIAGLADWCERLKGTKVGSYVELVVMKMDDSMDQNLSGGEIDAAAQPTSNDVVDGLTDGDASSDVTDTLSNTNATAGSEEPAGADDKEDRFVGLFNGKSRVMFCHELYIVLGVTNHVSDNSKIIDTHLRKLTYQRPGEMLESGSYHIFGNAIVPQGAPPAVLHGEELESLIGILCSYPGREYSVNLNPTGDSIRRTVFYNHCPAACNLGFLDDQYDLRDLINDAIPTFQPYRPICPACMGIDLLNEQLTLRGLVDAHDFDLGLAVEYNGRLNVRRRELGLPFAQFDEREWGYRFDDMLDDNDDANTEQYEDFEEAMDPNANPKTRPASLAMITALPRKYFAHVTKKVGGSDAGCAICLNGPYEPQNPVVELPCGHVYDEGCLVAWLAQYDNCPKCRASVSEMLAKKAAEEEKEDGESDTRSDAWSMSPQIGSWKGNQI